MLADSGRRESEPVTLEWFVYARDRALLEPIAQAFIKGGHRVVIRRSAKSPPAWQFWRRDVEWLCLAAMPLSPGWPEIGPSVSLALSFDGVPGVDLDGWGAG